MVIELNPLKWLSTKKPEPASTAPVPVTHDDIHATWQTQMAALDAAQPAAPAPAEENTMADTTTTVAPKESKIHSILDHLRQFFGIALKDVQEFVPDGAALAEAFFPQYRTAIEGDKAILIGAATTIQNTVLTVQQKYSEAAAGDTTNLAKLEDALAIVTPLLVPTLQSLKVPVPSSVEHITDKIQTAVAILKNYTVPIPATPANAQGK